MLKRVIVVWNAWIGFSVCSPASGTDIRSIGTDIHLLSENDLYGNRSDRTTGAILLGGELSYLEAHAACSAFGETLFQSDTKLFLSGINSSLSYQVYLGTFHGDQLFWVSSANSSNTTVNENCFAINVRGSIQQVSCNLKLPGLCTNSAPISSSSFADNSQQYQVIQHVGNAAFTGFRDLHTFQFRGIRYAPMPLRFDYSTLLDPSGITPALKFGDVCYRNSDTQGPVGSEDCLFLNIWTPFLPAISSSAETQRTIQPKPVMFWIHGGSFIEGSGSSPVLQGRNMASRGDVVVVSFNYRLGNLGFLKLDDGVHNGNYWLSDSINALEWVQEYITAFGGDPDRVTIWGESAGASAVRALLASPKAKGLFSGAIMQSGPTGIAENSGYTNYTDISLLSGKKTPVLPALLNETGCAGVEDTLSCLRGIDATAIITAASRASFPVVDGTYLTTRGLPLDGIGYAASVPVLSGRNRDELAVLTPFRANLSFSQYLETLTPVAGNYSHLAKNLIFAPPTSGNLSLRAFNASQRFLTDKRFKCLDQATAYSATLHHVFPAVYQFEFNRTYQPPDYNPTGLCPAAIRNPQQEEYFKCHAGELAFTHGNIAFSGLPDRDSKDTLFAQIVVDYWAAFARTGRPVPEPGYLEARGFWQSAEHIKRAGLWDKVHVDSSGAGLSIMRLQYGEGMKMTTPVDVEQCKTLGLPLDFYESVDFDPNRPIPKESGASTLFLSEVGTCPVVFLAWLGRLGCASALSAIIFWALSFMIF